MCPTDNLTSANMRRSRQAANAATATAQTALLLVANGVIQPAAHLVRAGELRVQYPTLSLSALGALATPQVNKFVMASRLRRLSEQAARGCPRCRRALVVPDPCCSAHGKKLCHRCYRETHFVEVCDAGCSLCHAEGLAALRSNWPDRRPEA